MNEQRLEAYRNLIQALFNCRSSKEISETIAANNELIDADLLQEMERRAEEFSEQAEERASTWLRGIANQLVLQKIASIISSSSVTNTDDYWAVLQEVIQAERESNFNTQVVYPILKRHQDKLDANFTRILKTWARDIFSQANSENDQAVAGLINLFSTQIQKFPWGIKANNVEIAIAGYSLALEVYTKEAFPEKWAMIQNNLGVAYYDRIWGEKAENLEQAIAAYEKALQVRTQEAFPEKWAMTQDNLGNAYDDRIWGEKAENLEQAIAAHQKALKVFTRESFPEKWAMTQSNLGNAYKERIWGEKAENLEQAIAAYKKALKVVTKQAFPFEWAMTQNNLGNVYSQRIAGDRRENLEQAIACYQLALQERRQDNVPLDWAATQHNLAIAYSQRIAGDRRENLEQAIACYQLALQERRQDNVPLDCLQTRRNLGNLYFKEENWQQAIESYQIALEIIEDTRLQSLDEKRRQEIIAENIMVFVNIVRCFIQLKQYDKAIEYAGRSKTRNLVELITNRDLYPKGDIPQEVLAKLNSLRREILIETRKQFNQNEIKPFNRDYNLEQGRQPTPNLSPVIPDYSYVNQLQKELDQLIERDINPIDPDFKLTQKVTPISFEEIKALIDDDTAIIEWYFTDKEILTFITTKQDRQPLVKPVSSFDEFRKLMSEYLDLYLTNKQKWRTQLPSLLSKFAQILNLEEIIRSLEEKYSQITLIPHLYLHLLPLQAFPLTDGKCLLDHFKQVKYAPSCQLLQLIKNRQPQGLTNLFGVQNPTQDLPYTDIEVETISQIFKPHDDILIQEKATKTALQAKHLEIQHYSHFSCHGYFNFNKPLDSALILAGAKVEQNGNLTLSKQVRDLRKNKIPLLQPLLSGFNRVIGKLFKRKSVNDESLPEKFIRSSEGETIDLEKCLTLGDVFELDLRQCRLVTLSACETAITDIKSISDEYISLPSGFLFAGACNVVATQWAVNDLSTAILMIKFYQLHRIDGLPVAKAMNEAQKWLRDGTQEVFWKWTEQLKNHLKLKQDLIKKIQDYLEDFSSEEQPFSKLFYWAAFCAIGE